MSKPVEGSLAAHAAAGNQAAELLVAEHKSERYDAITSLAILALGSLVAPCLLAGIVSATGGTIHFNIFIPFVATSAFLTMVALNYPIYKQYIVNADRARTLEKRFDKGSVKKDLQRMHDQAAAYLDGVESRKQLESSLKEDAAALLPKQADE